MKRKNAIPEFKISLKKKGSVEEMFTVDSSEDAAKVCKQCFDSDVMDWKEEFIVIALNRAHKVLGFYKVSSGGVAGTVVDPKVVFQFALMSNASSIILCHNHPSGSLKHSSQDVDITSKLTNAGKLLDIQVLDHIIITSEGYYSFSDSGLI